MGLGPICKICGRELDFIPMNKLTFVSGIGHFCEDCIKKIKMKISYGDKSMVMPQEQMDELLRNPNKEQIGENCLAEAQKIINGNRQNDYGTPEDSFQRIADYWNSYLFHRKDIREGYTLESKDIAMMMVLFKIAREEHAHKHDNLVDICGYTAILDNMYNKE